MAPSAAIVAFADKVNADFEKIQTSVDGIAGDVTELKKTIAALQASAGTISAEDQALLDTAEGQIASLASKTEALDAQTEAPIAEAPQA